MRVAIVCGSRIGLTETFVRAHLRGLPHDVYLVEGTAGITRPAAFASAVRDRLMAGLPLPAQLGTQDRRRVFARSLRLAKPDVVLAEYGPIGVAVRDVCQDLGVPLVVHFHGYDATKRPVVDTLAHAYQELFDAAAAVVVVSRAMRTVLSRLGAGERKLFLNPYGVPVPAQATAIHDGDTRNFLAVGRLVEKKSPHLLLHAFARVCDMEPDARLSLVGDGPLSGVARDTVNVLDIAESVELAGAESHADVLARLRRGCVFVQHSVTAVDGDGEGTPNSILEAAAHALPIVATRHAGIPDVIEHGRNGLLVQERDVRAMADAMVTMLRYPDMARRMGTGARAHVAKAFDESTSATRLSQILLAAAGRGPWPPLPHPALDADARVDG